MKQLIMGLFKTAFKIVETMAPNVAGKWAIKLFLTPMKHKRPAREQKLIQTANTQTVMSLW